MSYFLKDIEYINLLKEAIIKEFPDIWFNLHFDPFSQSILVHVRGFEEFRLNKIMGQFKKCRD